MTEIEVVGWHQLFDGHERGQALGDSEGQGGLVCYSHEKSQTGLSD